MDFITMSAANPQLAEQLGQLGTIPGRISDQQALLAQGLRARQEEAPSGMYTRGGYTAASPLQHIATLGRQFKGGRQAQQAQQDITGLRDQQAKGREAYMRALIEQLRRRSSEAMPGYADPNSGPRMA